MKNQHTFDEVVAIFKMLLKESVIPIDPPPHTILELIYLYDTGVEVSIGEKKFQDDARMVMMGRYFTGLYEEERTFDISKNPPGIPTVRFTGENIDHLIMRSDTDYISWKALNRLFLKMLEQGSTLPKKLLDFSSATLKGTPPPKKTTGRNTNINLLRNYHITRHIEALNTQKTLPLYKHRNESIAPTLCGAMVEALKEIHFYLSYSTVKTVHEENKDKIFSKQMHSIGFRNWANRIKYPMFNIEKRNKFQIEAAFRSNPEHLVYLSKHKKLPPKVAHLFRK